MENKQKKEWKKPEIVDLDAQLSEHSQGGPNTDGGTAPNHKSS